MTFGQAATLTLRDVDGAVRLSRHPSAPPPGLSARRASGLCKARAARELGPQRLEFTLLIDIERVIPDAKPQSHGEAHNVVGRLACRRMLGHSQPGRNYQRASRTCCSKACGAPLSAVAVGTMPTTWPTDNGAPMAKCGKPKRRSAARAASARPERQQDPRLAATPATAIGDEPLSPGRGWSWWNPWRWMMDANCSGIRRSLWLSPWSKQVCDRAVPVRRQIVGNLRRRDNDTFEPANSHRTLDMLSDLWSAVLHSFAAIEAIANDSIDRLPDDAIVTIGKKERTRSVAKDEMVRVLNLDEKFGPAVPMLDIGEPIKGRRPWERYLHLKGLRDDLVHVKDRGVDPDRGPHRV